MVTGVVLPEWKRFNTKFIRPDVLNLLNDGNEALYEKYIQSFGDVFKSKYIIGNIDGYLSEHSERYKPDLSLSTIDLAKDIDVLPQVFSLMKLDTEGRGKFHSMDESFLQLDKVYGKGFYIHLKNTVTESVVEFVRATQESGILVHHDLIILEPQTHITMLRIVEGSNGGMISDNVEIYAGSGSSIEYITLNRSRKGVFSTAVKRAQVSEGAKVNWYNVDLYESDTAMSTRSMLAGHGAETRMTGVVVGKGEAQKDMSYETFHTAPDTVTSVLVRAAVLDKAKVVYRALTHIASGSKRAKVEQAEKSIMLGEHARFDGIPSLWIDEDDVIASHSASSGMVDEQTMFYLKSRGIPHKQAEKLITDGFIASLLNKVPLNLLKGLY
jgi:Fe-S cluster assembly protein SufD